MGLLVFEHLHPVLEAAKLDIGSGHFGGDVGGQVPFRDQGGERIDRPGTAQRRIAAAEDQLLGLGVELDLADAAAPELQIGARRLHRLAGLVDVDLSLDRLDVEDGLIVEAAAPDEGDEGLQELRRRAEVAADGAGLDEGRPFPVLADALVVVERHGHGDDRWSRRRIGA